MSSMFAKILRQLAGKKVSETKKSGKDCGQIREGKETTKSVKFAKDTKFGQTTEVPHRSSSPQKFDKSATGKPPVLRKEKHPSLLNVEEQELSCQTHPEIPPIAKSESSSTTPCPASTAIFPHPRTPGCDHFKTMLINTDMAGKSMASYHARWVYADGTSTTRTRGAVPFIPILDLPTLPFPGLDPSVPGTTIVRNTVIYTDEAGNSALHCSTTCTLLDGTSKTQTHDPIFTPAFADKVGDPSPASHAIPAAGAPLLNNCTSGVVCPPQARTQTASTSSPIGSSSSGCTSGPVTEPANPQSQPKPRQPRPFYLQPWTWNNTSIASHGPVYSIPPPLSGGKTIVRKPKFHDITPRPEKDNCPSDEACVPLLNRVAEQKTELKDIKPEHTQPKVSPTFDDILVASNGFGDDRPELKGKKRKQTRAKQSKAKRAKKMRSGQHGQLGGCE